MERIASANPVTDGSSILRRVGSRDAKHRSDLCPSLLGSLQYSSRHRARHSGETHQVAGAHGELELLIDALQSVKHGLPNPADGLAPTQVLLDSFVDDLADSVTQMAGSTAVNGAAATTGIVGIAAIFRFKTLDGLPQGVKR
jgi:hypothetical protein